MKDKESFPVVAPGREKVCLVCGHCVAVCPHGALRHEGIPFDRCPPLRKELLISEDQAVQFLRSRRSIRVFKNKPVERDTIQRVIDIARYAPTGGNAQPLEWLVLTDPEELRALAGLTIDWMRDTLEKDPESVRMPYMSMIVKAWDAGINVVLWNAPVVVVASAHRDTPMGLVDVTIALTYLELAALPLGLGTCWAGLLQGALLSWKPLQEAMALPEGHVHHYPMMLGYPKLRYHRLPERKEPRITWR
jgi:nitroreductase